jgi:hypothetical protein
MGEEPEGLWDCVEWDDVGIDGAYADPESLGSGTVRTRGAYAGWGAPEPDLDLEPEDE